MKHAEQICPNETPGYRAVCKKITKRAMRRAAKRDPEGAPRKIRFRGYTT